MTTYRTSGRLTNPVPEEGISLAQAYLVEDDMLDYLRNDEASNGTEEALHSLEWKLEDDGLNYSVTLETTHALTRDQLAKISSWVSGQNSDGLGEGFEQQNFAEIPAEEEEYDCPECGGTGEVEVEEEDEPTSQTCDHCGGDGTITEEPDPLVCSFDWETNDCTFTLVTP